MTAAGLLDSAKRPLVSVIIAAYQQPELLNAAIGSILEQAYQPIEIIVVDDASGPECVAQYRLPPGARLIVQEKRQSMVAVARNTALQVAQGKYVALLDQDDLWVRAKTAWQVELMENDADVVMTYGHLQLADAQLVPLATQRLFRPLGDDPVAKFIRRNRVPCPSQVMLRRGALDRIGPFDETIRGASDWDMWLRCCMAGKVVSDSRVMTTYRQHEAQWSRNRVMIHEAQVRVLTKAAGWVLPQRPDLKGVLEHSLSRALRKRAMALMATGAGRRAAAKSLLEAIRTRPGDVRNYAAVVSVLRGVASGI